MALMRDETFGPAVGIQRVSSDGEALALMNDSAYALTASIFTASADRFLEMEGDVEAGTVFLNRCDVLDPALAWTGAKESGRGVSLSKFGTCGGRRFFGGRADGVQDTTSSHGRRACI
jgi:acyl-CoA reductase-like NAD-dependent aldehyde dehydrogenase